MQDCKFEVFYKNDMTAQVEVKNDHATINRLNPDPIRSLFYKDEMDAFHVAEILEGRCWERNRQGLDDLLKKIGVSYYDPLEIVKKTHGLMRNDYTWIRFEGEDLTYDDIKIRE